MKRTIFLMLAVLLSTLSASAQLHTKASITIQTKDAVQLVLLVYTLLVNLSLYQVLFMGTQSVISGTMRSGTVAG